MSTAAGDKKQSNRSGVSRSAAVTATDRPTVVTVTNYQPVLLRIVGYSTRIVYVSMNYRAFLQYCTGLPSRILTCTELKGHCCLLQFLATCARLRYILSFRVHVKLCYRIVSYRIVLGLEVKTDTIICTVVYAKNVMRQSKKRKTCSK